MAKRQPISKKIRFNVFKRDRFTCQYCGNKPPNIVLEIDHVIPVSKNGDNSELNLLTSCFDCNRGKSNRSLKDIPESIENNLKREVEASNQLKELNKFLTKKKRESDKIIKELLIYWFDNFNDSNKLLQNLSKKRSHSINIFLKRIPKIKIKEGMDLAISQCEENSEYNLWKYFCGIIWNWIKE